jgi:hypothetical protein
MSATITKARKEFGTRADSKREKVMVQLYAAKNKPVNLSAVAKKVYGKADEGTRNAVKMTILGLNIMITKGKLPYQQVSYEGRGEEATFMLATKKKRAA